MAKGRLGRLRVREREPRVGEPVESIARHLERLVVRLGLAGVLAAALLVAALDARTAGEVAVALANMGVVVVTSWRFGAPGRWSTVLLAAICWTAATELRDGSWPAVFPWWPSLLRLGVLVTLAAGVSTFRAAIGRLLRTEDALAATVVRERDSALRDRLTRLWNSRYLDEALEREIARCRRYGRPFGLLLVDLDGFKGVNDTAGHLAGDLVLQIVGRILRENCRATDVPTRLGGDEFAVVLPEASPEMVRRYAAKLVGLIAGAPLPADLPRVTASVGGVVFHAAPASARAAIAAADAAMYAAKRDGKNRAFVAAAPRA
ncbi:MAG: GGDEF domain-containing protein [Candidatus Rokubacteria bacterium]|nr:GGDEF domain-containing protein [Candidatus Rokubacteria bacterium]